MTSVKLDRASDTGISSGTCSMRPCYRSALRYKRPCCTISGMETNPQMLCSGLADGLPCLRPAATASPFPICQRHRVEIAASVIPELLGRELLAIPTVPLPTPEAVTIESLLNGPHEDIVYFIANGGRVKIGYSTNLLDRVRSLSLREGDVLTALAGGFELEQTLHAHFAEHRRGNTEWFDLAPEIVRYISMVSKDTRPGEPRKASGGSWESTISRLREKHTENILVKALQVFDDLETDRVSRSQLATHLAIRNEDELRSWIVSTGCRAPRSIAMDGTYRRGWYRRDIESALKASCR